MKQLRNTIKRSTKNKNLNHTVFKVDINKFKVLYINFMKQGYMVGEITIFVFLSFCSPDFTSEVFRFGS